ncbi:MAG: transcriptional repressor LexA [Candidatus Uhrbacteria bacterium]|nr:transcriptional repressor LexA [Candidatus Uhrbacteria bacterium]
MKEALAKIRRFYQKKKRMPSFSEVAGLIGYKSKNAASKLVDKLIEMELLAKDDQGKLLPGSAFRGVPVLGTVAAGFPSPAEEELCDTLSLDEFLVPNREKTFLLNVTGDSMIDAGIIEGDMVLAERGVQPRSGDIVIAEIDHEWTMKYFVRDGVKVVLRPGNEKYPVLVPRAELKIAAVVKGVIRKY